MSGKMEHQLASKRSLKLDTVVASAMCGGSLFHGPTERTTLLSGKRLLLFDQPQVKCKVLSQHAECNQHKLDLLNAASIERKEKPSSEVECTVTRSRNSPNISYLLNDGQASLFPDVIQDRSYKVSRRNILHSSSSCPGDPVLTSLWVCGSDTRDLLILVPNSGETSP